MIEMIQSIESIVDSVNIEFLQKKERVSDASGRDFPKRYLTVSFQTLLFFSTAITATR